MKRSDTLLRLGNPRTLVTRFIARASLPGALLWGTILGLYVAANGVGYASTFPSLEQRLQLANSFGTNIGLKALLGVPNQIETVRGFDEWRGLGVIILVGAAWGMLLSVKTFRGEEDEGRWEMLLSGATSKRRAVLQALLGLGASLFVYFTLIFLLMALFGQHEKVQIDVRTSFYFALTASAAPALFIAFGALASQIGSTKQQAMRLVTGLYAASFFLRAIADSTGKYEWIRYLTPFGWVEEIRVLTHFSPLWFIPIVLCLLVVSSLAFYLASVRDLGTGFLQDRPPKRVNTLFLGSTTGLTFRLTRFSLSGWIIVAGLMAAAFGGLSKSAAEALADSLTAQKFLHNFANVSDLATTFLGVIFMILMVLLMIMATGCIGGIREEEASSHLDYLLVRSTSRASWLSGRTSLSLFGILLAGLTAGITSWLTTRVVGLDISFSKMVFAGINVAIPAIGLLGFGVFLFGLFPRFAVPVCYAIVAYAFLIQFLTSLFSIPGWVLDLSLLHHMSLAPAGDPDWGTASYVLLISFLAAVLGGVAFTRRDIATE